MAIDKVKLRIETKRYKNVLSNECETSTAETTGLLRDNAREFSLSYKLINEENGEKSQLNTKLTFRTDMPGTADLEQSGSSAMNIHFVPGQTLQSEYYVMGYTLPMEVKTISVKRSDECIDLVYHLTFSEMDSYRYELKITFEKNN